MIGKTMPIPMASVIRVARMNRIGPRGVDMVLPYPAAATPGQARNGMRRTTRFGTRPGHAMLPA